MRSEHVSSGAVSRVALCLLVWHVTRELFGVSAPDNNWVVGLVYSELST